MGLKVRSKFGRILLISAAWFFGVSSVGLMVGLKMTGMFDALGDLREREAKAKELCLIATADELAGAYYVPDRRNGGPAFASLLKEFERESGGQEGTKRYGEYRVWPLSRNLKSSDPSVMENRRLVTEIWAKAEPLLKADHVRFRYDFRQGHAAVMTEIFALNNLAYRILGDAFWLAMEGKTADAALQFARAEVLRKVAQDNFASDLALIEDERMIRRELRVFTMLANKKRLQGSLRSLALRCLSAEASFKNLTITRKIQLYNDLHMVSAKDIRALARDLGLKDEDMDGQLWIKLQPIGMFQNAWKSTAIDASLKLKELCDAQDFHFVEEYQLASEQADNVRFAAGYLPSLPWARLSSFSGIGAPELPAIREELRKAMAQ